MFNLEGLLGSLVGGALGARSKPHRRVERFLGGGKGSFLNAGTLLTAAALGYGAYEIWRTRQGSGPQNATLGGSGAGVPPLAGGSAPVASRAPLPPPLPGTRSSVEVVATPTDGLPRIAGLLMAAARADGELGETEYAHVLRSAREHGADTHVMAALSNPKPLEALVEGVRDPLLAADLYVLAFSVVHADEGVNAAERTWLDRLARLLSIDAATSARLERETIARIAAVG